MRLNMFTVYVPPMRERKDDIPLLIEHFLHYHCKTMGKTINGITEKAMSYLIGHHWSKGNVRELSNAIERAVILCDEDYIKVKDLPSHITGTGLNTPSLELKTAVQQFQHSHINAVLESLHGNRELAAEVLGISVSTLYRHLASYDASNTFR